MKKIRITSIIVALSVLLFSIPVKATEEATRDNNGLSTDNVTKMTQEEYTYVFTELTRDIFDNNAVASDVYYHSFTEDCYVDYIDFVHNNELKGDSILERSIEYVSPENSGKGDAIIMANIKVSFLNTYNMCYLFEYHIDSNGKICDYEIWQY